MKRLLEEAKRLIATPSVSAGGNEELVTVLTSSLKERGFSVRTQLVTHSIDQVSRRQFNIIGTIGDPLVDAKIRRGILLLSHLDTSRPGAPNGWTKVTSGSAFELAYVEGQFFGLGVASSKLDFLCKIRAAERFRERKIRQPIYVVGTCGKELGFLGTQYLIGSKSVNPSRVVVGEPTGLMTVSEGKSKLVLCVNISFQGVERDARGFNRRVKLTANGKSVDAGVPKLGSNALEMLIRVLEAAKENGFELRLSDLRGGELDGCLPHHAEAEFFLTSHHFEDFRRYFQTVIQPELDPGDIVGEYGGLGESGVRFAHESTFSAIVEIVQSIKEGVLKQSQQAKVWGYIQEGVTGELVKFSSGSGKLSMIFDIRASHDVSIKNLKSEIQSSLKNVSLQYPILDFQMSILEEVPPFVSSVEDDWFRTCASIATDCKINYGPAKTCQSTEASLFLAAGYPTLLTGPGELDKSAHCMDECVPLDQLERAVEYYESLIERVCL